MSFSWNIKVMGFGPFARQAGGSMELSDSRVAVYAGNGQGKTCISRLFRAAEPGTGNLPDHLINYDSKNGGTFSFSVKQPNEDDKTLSISMASDGTQSVSNGTGLIFHVFNSDYVQENLISLHYSLSGDSFSGYIIGKENIDVSTKRERLNILLQQGRQKRAAIEQIVNRARSELADFKLTRIKNYKELTTENILSLDVEPHDYDAALNEFKALRDLPENIPTLAGLSFDSNCVDLDSLETLIKTSYSRDEFSEDFINEISPKRSFIDSGLDLLDGDVCPFCGMRLNDEARLLIKSYEAYVQGQEAKVAADIESNIKDLMFLKSSYEAFKVSYQDKCNWLVRLKPAFPGQFEEELPVIPEPIDFDVVVDSVINLLNEKAENISIEYSCDAVDKLRKQLTSILDTIFIANSTLSALDKSTSSSARALTAAKQNLCVEMAKKVRSDCDSLIEERRAISEDYAALREEIKADEDQGRRSRRDAVAETLASLIHTVFGSKYTFDPEHFTVQLDNVVLGNDAEGVMSDGEKSVLAFCYYIASTWSLLDLEEDSKNLFFMVDDPISSMDYHYVYSVAQIIKSLGSLFTLSPVRLLLTTHNTAFFNLLSRNKIIKNCFTFHDGVVESCTSRYLAPYGEHLKDLYEVARGECKPTHTTGNSIRQVIETLWRFDCPSARSLGNYLDSPSCSDLCECEYIYTLCQDLSHGATPFDREQPPDDEAVRRACRAVIAHIHERYPGQLIALDIDDDFID